MPYLHSWRPFGDVALVITLCTVIFLLSWCAKLDLVDGAESSPNDPYRSRRRLHRRPGRDVGRLRTSDDETFLIRQGRHPSISYPNLSEMNDTDINIRWVRPDEASGKMLIVDADDCPRHFLWLSDQAVEAEFEYRLRPENTKQRWSDRVLVEKVYFTLFYGGTGTAPKYIDAADNFETDLEGWDIMDRNLDEPVDANIHCDWEGLECNDDGELTEFRLDGFSLQGTLPNDLVLFTKLEVLDLNFNSIKGTIPAEYGTELTNLQSLNLASNELTGRLPSTLVNLVNLESIWLNGNKLRGTISDKILERWTNLVGGDFSENNFRGHLGFLRTLSTKAPNLRSLYLEGNQLSGSLPSLGTQASGMVAFPSLEVLDLGHNKITGTIHESWFSLPSLRDLNLVCAIPAACGCLRFVFKMIDRHDLSDSLFFFHLFPTFRLRILCLERSRSVSRK